MYLDYENEMNVFTMLIYMLIYHRIYQYTRNLCLVLFSRVSENILDESINRLIPIYLFLTLTNLGYILDTCQK